MDPQADPPGGVDGPARRDRPQSRRALYAATALAALGGIAAYALWRGDAMAPLPQAWPSRPRCRSRRQPATPRPRRPAPPPPRPRPPPPRRPTPLPAARSACCSTRPGTGRRGSATTRRSHQPRPRPEPRAEQRRRAGADGELQSAKGDQQAAAAALERLRKVAPDDPRFAELDQAMRVGAMNPDQLAEARRLAQSGRRAEAIERYNKLFRGNPPPDALGVEYYQTLAGTEGGYDRAKAGLAQLVRQNSQDLRGQLAYAQLLTYRDGTGSKASSGSRRCRRARRSRSPRPRRGGGRWAGCPTPRTRSRRSKRSSRPIPATPTSPPSWSRRRTRRRRSADRPRRGSTASSR